MYCPNCQSEYNGMFCPRCGYSAQNQNGAQGYSSAEQYNNASYQPNSTYQNYQKPNNSNIVFDNNEKIISILGNNYLQTFVSSGTLGKGFAVLSDKRIYFKGKCLTRIGSHWVTSKEERAVNIEDITGTGFTLISQIYWLILSAVLIFGGICFAIGDMGSEGLMMILFSLLFIAVYFVTKKTIFEINYPGGSIAFNLKLIKKTEAEEFQKNVMLMKDIKRNEDIMRMSHI